MSRTRLLVALAIACVSSAAHAQIVFGDRSNGENGGGSTSLAINRPAGTSNGHFLVAQITLEKGSDVTVTAPLPVNSWTLVRRTDNSNVIGQAIYYRVATGSEPASYTWTFSQSVKAAGGILRYTGVDTSNPIVASTGNTGTTNPMQGLSVASVSNAMLVGLWGLKKKDSTMSTPTGMTERYIFQNANDVRVKAAEQLNPPNPTGNKDSTAGVLDAWVAQLVTLRPGTSATPGSFNAFESSTAAGAIAGVIRTKVAGTAFSLDVVAILAGAQLNAFTSQVSVDLLGNNTLGVALDANNCPTSFTTVQTVSPNPTISGGRSAVSFAAVANSWRDVRVRVRYPTSAPTVTSCSTDNFAIRPNALTSFSVHDNTWETAGTGRVLDNLTFAAPPDPAGRIHKAGRPFSVRATAVNSASATTGNYTGTPSASLTACAGAACTATFGTMTVGAAAAAGQLTSNVATYDNVGAFRAQLVDSTFASVDAADTAGDCTASGRYVCSAQLDVGRFVPDHFTVALTAPTFGTACGTFSYLGQLFSYTIAPVITVTARDFAGSATSLYAGNWWRITNTSLTPTTDQAARYSAASGTLDVSSLPNVMVDPAIAASGNGVGTLTFSSGTGLSFARTTAVAPFDADIALALNVIDADGVAYASNPVAFGAATPGGGIAFSAGKAQRFGRMRLLDAVGSEKLDLPIPLRTEYWTGSGFATNTLDNCTSVTAKNFVLSNWQGGLNAGNMVTPTAGSNGNVSTSGAFASGIGSFTLLRPNPAAASPGSVDICLDLDPGLGGDATCQAVTPGDKTRLRTLRTNPPNTYTQDPFARAAFGVYGGQPASFIYQRENY